MVAIDGSLAANEALHRAAALAQDVGAQLTVLHVATATGVSSFDSPRAHVRAEGAARLEGVRLLAEARAVASGVPLETEINFGPPAEVICRRAAEIGADLVVVGSRGLGGIDRLILGSVSRAVVGCAPCSVLVVREQD
jgi:nucleotide-binding universal stress UspA family protein